MTFPTEVDLGRGISIGLGLNNLTNLEFTQSTLVQCWVWK